MYGPNEKCAGQMRKYFFLTYVFGILSVPMTGSAQPIPAPYIKAQASDLNPPKTDDRFDEQFDALTPFDPNSLPNTEPDSELDNAPSLDKDMDVDDRPDGEMEPNVLGDENDMQGLAEDMLNRSLPFGERLNQAPSIQEDKTKSAETDFKSEAPDYSKLSKEAEKRARLDVLFSRLAKADTEEGGNLIAEEIWAIWLDSGSASVNLLIRRGTAAQKRKDLVMARRMYDHVTGLMPDYAEGWARSARLAIEEDDLNRALTETAETLIREPRHFYALWTMGNVLERLGRDMAALEAYSEAHRLYPELKPVKDRVEFMRNAIEGDVL